MRRSPRSSLCRSRTRPMHDVTETDLLRPTQARSVQDYIDERPMWPDGTHVLSVPMTGMQWRIWALAAAGKFFEGFVVFMTGVAFLRGISWQCACAAGAQR